MIKLSFQEFYAMGEKTESRAVRVYLLIVLGVCYLLGLLELVTESGKFYEVLAVGFTFIPVTAAFITRRITGERPRYRLSLRVWKNMKYWLLSAFLPGVLIAVGTVIYFLVFPENYSGVFRIGLRLGTETEIIVSHPIVLALLCILVSAVMIPIQLLELGEEIGWRGYILSFQIEKYGERKAVLINGLEWGIAHLPLIYFGFNYSSLNPGAPWSNMLVMLLLCLVLGIFFSYVTVRTGNCMYAAVAHGVVNTIGELPVYLSVNMESGLLGPNPTGLITMLPLIVLAVILLLKTDRRG